MHPSQSFVAWALLSALAVGSLDYHPKYARVAGNIETVWQRPAGDPRGIFFIAHGCQHQGTDIFSTVGPDGWMFKECNSSNFGSCLGLPEEMDLRRAARARGYVVMAVSGGSGQKSCWSMSKDAGRVGMAVRHVREAEGLPATALVLASGASSGGAFMGLLARPLDSGGLANLACIVPQIMGTRGAPNRGVPALFVHMPRDRATAMAVAADMEKLTRQGTRTAEIRVDPVPVTVELLRRCWGVDIAREAVNILKETNILDDKGYLQVDPRNRQWVAPFRQVLQSAGKSYDDEPDESCTAELMNVAWAQHEFTAHYSEQMLDFCEKKGVYGSMSHAGATENANPIAGMGVTEATLEKTTGALSREVAGAETFLSFDPSAGAIFAVVIISMAAGIRAVRACRAGNVELALQPSNAPCSLGKRSNAME